ncbi:MAG: hypothetical protein DMF69_03270, partial [Acidobacteria bacterium]
MSSQSSNSTGPILFAVSAPGTYTFHIQGIIDRHPNCSNISDVTSTISITVTVGQADQAQDQGAPSCNSGVGEPVSVTTGNVYLDQTDYRLPGRGDGLEIGRSYNSKKQASGLFGFGWTSILDESISTYGSLLLRVNLPDGGAIYFSRASTSDAFIPRHRSPGYRDVVKNVDNTYTLTFRDGSVHQFNTSGKLVSFSDRNGNTNSLTYTGANPTSLTDASGRTITFGYDGYGLIGSMSDSTGTIATYTHSFWGRLTEVAYADGS